MERQIVLSEKEYMEAITEPIINEKAIYSPKGAAREYGKVGCNFYKGCPHNCTYCYLKRGVLSSACGKQEVKLKACFKDECYAYNTFLYEIGKHMDYLRKAGIFFSFTTDPLVEQTRELTLDAAIAAAGHGIPVKILTKAADADYWLSFLHGITKQTQGRIAFGFTLTGCDEMEPDAPCNAQRIEAMKKMHNAGFQTFASIEPIVDVGRSVEVIRASAPYCNLFLVGLRSGVKKDYYEGQHLSRILNVLSFENEQNPLFKVYLKESFRKHFANLHVSIPEKDFFVNSLIN